MQCLYYIPLFFILSWKRWNNVKKEKEKKALFVVMTHILASTFICFSDRWFLFPEDQQIELECWAESAELSPTELLQMKVQDNRMFLMSPRSGKLQPSQQRAVQFTYR